MNKIVQLLTLLLTVLVTSCLTIEERITLNQDGSGTYRTFVDLGGMLSNPLIMGGIQSELEKEGKDVSMQLDSVIDLFSELTTKNPQWTNAERDLIRKVDSRMQMDLEKGKGGIYVNFDFESIEQLAKIQELMASDDSSAGGASSADNPMGAFSGGALSEIANEYGWKKGRFTRAATVPADLLGSMGGQEQAEMMDAMKMMMADAKITYIMEFPGEIKKVKGFPGHTVEEGRILRLDYGFLDMLEHPEDIDAGLDGSVKFKKK